MSERDENVRKISQFMLARGCVTSGEFYTFLDSLRGQSTSQLNDETIANSLSSMNGKLKRFNMMIRATVDDETQQKYYSLISTVDNAITKAATHYTPKEFDYFRQVWEVVRDGPIEKRRAKEMANSIKLNNNEELLEEWCQKYWIMEADGGYRLGPRSKAELDVMVDCASTQTL